MYTCTYRYSVHVYMHLYTAHYMHVHLHVHATGEMCAPFRLTMVIDTILSFLTGILEIELAHFLPLAPRNVMIVLTLVTLREKRERVREKERGRESKRERERERKPDRQRDTSR